VVKLIHSAFVTHLEFSETNSWEVVAEDAKLFATLVGDFSAQTENNPGGWVLSEATKEIALSKAARLIIDPFHADPNKDRSIVTKLNERLSTAASDEDHAEATYEAIAYVLSFFYHLVEVADLPFDVDTSGLYAVSDLVKSFGAKVCTSHESLASSIIDYCKVARELLETRLFCFVNLRGWISDNDVEQLCKEMTQDGAAVLLLERHDAGPTSSLQRLVIDEDFSEV
jgi:CRISPR type II-A-associated protein Csn2